MAPRLVCVEALCILAWSTAAGAQSVETTPNSSPSHASPIPAEDADPPPPHPLFGVATLSGELGGNYAAGAKVGVLATPFSGVSMGGAVFFAPVTSVQDLCTPPCNLHPLFFRGMAELRVGNMYTEYARSLGWLGVSAGVAYLAEPGLYPSPTVAIAGGGDLRLSSPLWLEVCLRLTGAEILGHGSPFTGTYITFGLEVGIRFDFAH